MIDIFQTGTYKLIETKQHIKILYLDDTAYAWIEPHNIGEILVMSHSPHRADLLLSMGAYRIYNVGDEEKLSDQMHMELVVGKGVWQGYLLPTGLPTDDKKRARIIPTREVITHNFTQRAVKGALAVLGKRKDV